MCLWTTWNTRGNSCFLEPSSHLCGVEFDTLLTYGFATVFSIAIIWQSYIIAVGSFTSSSGNPWSAAVFQGWSSLLSGWIQRITDLEIVFLVKVASFRLSAAAVDKVATERSAVSMRVSLKGTRDMALIALTLKINPSWGQCGISRLKM